MQHSSPNEDVHETSAAHFSNQIRTHMADSQEACSFSERAYIHFHMATFEHYHHLDTFMRCSRGPSLHFNDDEKLLFKLSSKLNFLVAFRALPCLINDGDSGMNKIDIVEIVLLLIFIRRRSANKHLMSSRVRK